MLLGHRTSLLCVLVSREVDLLCVLVSRGVGLLTYLLVSRKIDRADIGEFG